MKYLAFLIVFIVYGYNINGQNLYYYGNTKINLESDTSLINVIFKNNVSENKKNEIIKSCIPFLNEDDFFLNSFKNNTIVKINTNKILYDFESVLKKLNQFQEVIHSSSFYMDNYNNVLNGLTETFYVKLKNKENYTELLKLLAETNTELTEDKTFGKDIFFVRTSKTSLGNSLEMSRYFYETNFFEFSEPNFIRILEKNCVSNPIFNNQWNFSNTGQFYGNVSNDIKLCAAREITTGSSNINIAVIDDGIDLTHPSLVANLINGFDALGTANNGAALDFDAHGTACAGIIASNNNDILSVTQNCNIIPVRIFYTSIVGLLTTDSIMALGINWAWQNGADVLNCSWRTGNNNLINLAISNALNNGRNGLGSIVVFAAGNSDGPVDYPANSNPDILAVGAANMCGERKRPNVCDGENWGSCFGNQIDVVAPGVLISTTDLQGNNGYNPNLAIHTLIGGNLVNTDYANTDYTIWFNGTSAAAPHVAGVAALILSLDPCLTVQEVNEIIERSAQKTGPYNYQNNNNRPNGTWHQEMGYGLVNAEAALQEVLNQWILQNSIVTQNLLVAAHGHIRAGENVKAPPFGQYLIASGADVEFKATESISLEPGFTASAGSNFLAHIEDFNGDCNQWNSSKKLWVEAPNEEIYETFNNTGELLKIESITNFNPIFFPNPYNEKLYIKYDLENNESVVVQLYDLSGREVYNKVFNGHTGQNMHLIDVQTDVKMLIGKTCVNDDCKTSKLIKISE